MDRMVLDKACRTACKTGRAIWVTKGRTRALAWTPPPRPTGSFGLVGEWVDIGRRAGAGVLIIPFAPKALGWVSRRSLRMFRIEQPKSPFVHVADARLHPDLPAIYAKIDGPGAFGLIGLHGHPLVQDAIEALCRLGRIAAHLPASRLPDLRDRICKVALCAPELKTFFTSRDAFSRLAAERNRSVPDTMPPPLSRPGSRGETLCDRCHGIDVLDFPDCQVMEPSARPPCRDTPWESVGPRHISGAMRQVLVDPTNSSRLYAASANGGVWRLDDLADYPDGQVWRPLTDRLPDIRARAVAVAPGNGRIVYFANSLKRLRTAPPVVISEIYRSANRGVTWRAVHGPGMGVVHRLAVHPANAAVVFAATSTGLWRQNAAAPGTWTSAFAGDCLDVALDPDDSSIVYLGVRNRGLFKSFTSGADWTPAPILPFDPAAAGGNRLAILVALGVRNADGSLQTAATRTVAVRFGNELCLSHTAGEGAVPFSRHVPTREVPNPSPPPATVDSAPGDLNGGNIRRSDTAPRFASEWANCLAVDPFDPNHVLMGSVTLLETRDGGVTWRAVSAPHEDQQSVSFDATRRGVVYLASDGGVFSSVDGGATWPTMGLADTMPAPNRGLNLAMGLVTSELDRSYVRAGRAVAAIDHTGFVLSDDFSDRWQFLFNRPDRSARHAHENGFVYPCPASPDRCYVINTRVTDDPTGVTLRLAQFDFTRTAGLVDPPAFSFLSPLRASLPGDNGAYKPEDHIYLENLPGPFAAQVDVATGGRLLLFGAESTPAVGGFSVQSLRLAAAGTTVTAAATEVVSAEPFFALTFAPGAPGRAFAITRSGTLFERDFSTPGPFAASAALALGPGELFVSRLVAVQGADPRLFALTQHALHRLVRRPGAAWTTLVSWPDPDETLLSLAPHPGRDGTLFLGTNRGVHLSEDDGVTWRPFNTALPPVAVTELTFDQGYLYAATFGRGLWRCRPCT